jgi:hypothetical protein
LKPLGKGAAHDNAARNRATRRRRFIGCGSLCGARPGAGLPDGRANDHFDITCAPEFDRQAITVGRQAENAYQRVSSSLQRDLSFRPLLVLFPTSADQTRAIDTRTIPGNREHVLVALDTPENRIEGQFIHELSHVSPADFDHELDGYLNGR